MGGLRVLSRISRGPGDAAGVCHIRGTMLSVTSAGKSALVGRRPGMVVAYVCARWHACCGDETMNKGR